jgi:hypothetical protein
MTIEAEESEFDRVYRYALIDLTTALETLANRTGIPLPPRWLYTKQDYVRTLAGVVLQRLGPHALDAASSNAITQTARLFPRRADIVAMCHAHFLGEYIQ